MSEKNKCVGLDCEMCGNTKCPNEEKEPIINGIDVSECEFYEEERNYTLKKIYFRKNQRGFKMTEIEKMYENVGIKKREIENCTYKNSTPCGHSCDDGEDCPYLEIKTDYPPFTAEKQLKIIQLLSKIRNDIQLCYSDNKYIFVVNFETEKCQWANKYHDKINEALADMVNVSWQSLTDQEKEEIRVILNA